MRIDKRQRGARLGRQPDRFYGHRVVARERHSLRAGKLRYGEFKEWLGGVIREYYLAIRIGDDDCLRQPVEHRFQHASPRPGVLKPQGPLYRDAELLGGLAGGAHFIDTERHVVSRPGKVNRADKLA